MPSSVKIVEVSRVAASGAATATPAPLLRLSALDAPWVLVPLIQRLLLFGDGVDGSHQLPPFASLVGSLRASLAATLARFPPLAGRIVFLPSTGDAAIDCSGSEGGGVRFVVAESDDADAGRLAGDADHDVDTFKRLVPELDVGALPLEVLAVQVTRLRGGVALGVALHHAVVDGRSVWTFLEAWAAASRGVDALEALALAPTFDRAAVALPGGEELARSTLRKYAPNLPLVTQFPVGPTLPRRTFTMTAQHIRSLKQRIADLTSSSAQAATPPSSFVAVVALAWVSFVRSKHPAVPISADQDIYLFFFFDCRGRRGMDPPVSESYFGTCITGCLAKAKARDLLAEGGVAAAAAAVQEEVRRAVADPLALWDWMTLASTLSPEDSLVSLSGSTRFAAYEAADFGWGAPSRTELVTMNHEGQVVLVAAKGGGGAVQASVSMDPAYMDAFSSHFLNASS